MTRSPSEIRAGVQAMLDRRLDDASRKRMRVLDLDHELDTAHRRNRQAELRREIRADEQRAEELVARLRELDAEIDERAATAETLRRMIERSA